VAKVPSTTEPQHGDTLITLRCDDPDILKRYDLLFVGFYKWVQGATLRQVLNWRIKEGWVRFVIVGPAQPPPRGTLEVTLADVSPEIEQEVRILDVERGGEQ